MTDRIKKGEVTVDWCPTYEMTGDFFTKPNQGSLFRRFRDMMETETETDHGDGDGDGDRYGDAASRARP